MIIAEIGANHCGSFNHARDLILAAHEAGAEAVKFQAYRPEDMTLDLDKPEFRIKKGLWGGRKLFDLYKQGATPFEWLPELFAFTRNLNMIPFASVFSIEAVDFLEGLSPAYYKIASFEITDTELILKAASTGKPLIISTGVGTQDDIQRAVIAASLHSKVTLLHCVSSYPAKPEDYNLQNICWLAMQFGCDVGLSDHSLSTTLPAVSIGLGAKMIEKHLCISRKWGGLDAAFSLEPDEFKRMTEAVKEARAAMMPIDKPAEFANLKRSLYAVKDIAKGETFTADNVKAIRPGHGMAPYYYHSLLGKRAAYDIALGTPMKISMVIHDQERSLHSAI